MKIWRGQQPKKRAKITQRKNLMMRTSQEQNLKRRAKTTQKESRMTKISRDQ